MTKRIEQIWLSFEKTVLASPNIGPIQRLEMRKAFYAGALAVLTIEVSDEVINSEDEVGAQILDDLWGECRDFAQAFQPGNPQKPFTMNDGT